MNYKFEISVIVITYNSKWEKLKTTLASLIEQKNILYEIIISDDGSEENNYEEVIKFFVNNNFSDYRLIDNKYNVGTVKNIIKSLEQATGEYVKIISPGDFLPDKFILSEWFFALKESGRKWSFGDYVSSTNTSTTPINIFSRPLMPQDVTPYLNHDDKTAIYNYVVKKDRSAGPAALCEKVTWLTYLRVLSKMVIYAEDLAFFLMMADGIVPLYYRKNVVVYEVGSGISTSGNPRWNYIMNLEKQNVYEYIESFFFMNLFSSDRDDFINYDGKLQKHKRMSSINIYECELTEYSYGNCCKKELSNIVFPEEKQIWIYGAGFGGKIALNVLREMGIFVSGFIDINYKNIQELDGIQVMGMGVIDPSKTFLIITLLEYIESFVDDLKNYGFKENDYIYIYANDDLYLNMDR